MPEKKNQKTKKQKKKKQKQTNLIAGLVVVTGARLDVSGAAEAEQGGKRLGKGVEEGLLVGGKLIDVDAERRVVAEREVGRQHHEAVSLGVLVLERAIPVACHPLLLHQVPEVLVVKLERRVRPRAIKAGPGCAGFASKSLS